MPREVEAAPSERRSSFDKWANDHNVSQHVQIDILHEAVEIATDEREAALKVVEAAEKFLADMDALENPRPASSWFALKDAIKAVRDAA